MAKRDPLYDQYLKARAQAWKTNQVKLTEKEFLSSIDPHRKYTDDNARYFMRKLREGEWTSQNALQRSRETEGNVYNILLKDSSGAIVDSINMELPEGVSLWESYRNGGLKQAIDDAMGKRYDERVMSARRKGLRLRRNQRGEEELEDLVLEQEAKEAKEEAKRAESIGRRSMKGLEIAGANYLPPGHVHKRPYQVINMD